jgi:hypothetical protein
MLSLEELASQSVSAHDSDLNADPQGPLEEPMKG